MEMSSREGGIEKSRNRADDIFFLKQAPGTNLTTWVWSQQQEQNHSLSQKGLRLCLSLAGTLASELTSLSLFVPLRELR